MKREELDELHYITPISNVASILTKGILSHNLATKVSHQSVAMQEVQEIRMNKLVQGTNGLTIHDYANVYICARNPMMYKRKDDHALLCVLQVNTTILDIDGAIVTDRNAAASIASFRPAKTGLLLIDREKVFADDWRHPGDQLEYMRHRSIKCAEVLIPNKIPSNRIIGVYVSCVQSQVALSGAAPNLKITINPHLFFQEARQ